MAPRQRPVRPSRPRPSVAMAPFEVTDGFRNAALRAARTSLELAIRALEAAEREDRDQLDLFGMQLLSPEVTPAPRRRASGRMQRLRREVRNARLALAETEAVLAGAIPGVTPGPVVANDALGSRSAPSPRARLA